MRKEYIYEQKKIGKYTVKVVQDEYPQDPREWDNLGTMVCFHRNYILGDKHNFSIEKTKEIAKDKNYLSLPLFLYDHSGITMNTTGFSCPWDSGQVGIIFVSKEMVLKEYNAKRITKKLREKVYDLLRAEVETYDQYLTDDVYGFRVEDENGEIIESCWGFYGESEDCLAEGISMAQACIRQDIKKHVEQVKRWIRNRVPLELRKPLEVYYAGSKNKK